MTGPGTPSLAWLIQRLLEKVPCGDLNGVQDHLQLLTEAVSADASAMFQGIPGKGTARLTGGSGNLLSLTDEQDHAGSAYLAEQADQTRDVPALALTGPFPPDPFLDREGARSLLIRQASDGGRRLITTALRRDPNPFNPHEIETFAAVSGVINLAWINSPLIWGQEASGSVDAMTGLGLYTDFHQSMVKELSRARRDGASLTMGILSVVPGEGRTMGDVLPDVARTLQGLLRNFDTLDRYSTRGLAFILPGLTSNEGVRVVSRVLGEARAVLGSQGPAPEIYIGLSCYPEDGATAERLIEMAEAAMNKSIESSLPGAFRWEGDSRG